MELSDDMSTKGENKFQIHKAANFRLISIYESFKCLKVHIILFKALHRLSNTLLRLNIPWLD